MTDQSSIFGTQQNSPDPASQPNNAPTSNGSVAQPNPDPFADLLGQIKNERGEPKYRSVEDALKGTLHAQQFISTLQAEKAAADAELQRLRAEAEKARVLEETIERLTSQKPQTPETPANVLKEDQVAELVTRVLTEREQKALAQQNIQSVVSNLQQQFGAEAEQKFYGKAAELGLSKEEMNALAAKSPTAVLAMLGVQKQTAQPNVTPTQSTINSTGLQPAPQTFVGRNDTPTLVGATTEDIKKASERANKMVDELHAQGKSIHDLTDPRVFFKHFGR